MIFNSYDFLLFALVFFAVFFVLPKKLKLPFILFSSYFFYGWWNVKFLSLILISTVVDFFVSQKIEDSEDPKTKKIFLWISLAVNLGILGLFKYYDFFTESFADVLNLVGMNVEPVLLGLILPLGISFYTFQTIGYTLDVYKGKIKAERRFLNFAVFVSYFPQLVAGPIERAKNLLPQFDSAMKPTGQQFREGLWLIAWGFFLKVVIADNLASVVTDTYNSTRDTTGMVWMATLAFIIQIYGDFAGYSKIARGVSKFLGIDLIQNFQQPYLATSVSDLWRRWHMSLSVWANDYIFFPYVFKHKNRVVFGLLLTFVIIGVWHGANWTFFVFGLWHGSMIALEHVTLKKRRKLMKKVGNLPFKMGGWAFAMFVWIVGCIFFRSQNVSQGFSFLKEFLTFDFSGLSNANAQINFFWTIVFLLIIFIQNAICRYKKTEYMLSFKKGYHYLFLFTILGFIFLFGAQTEDFIYFQF